MKTFQVINFCNPFKIQDTFQINILENSITINKPEEVIARNGGIKKFFFTDIFEPEATQEDIMKQTCTPLIDDLINLSISICHLSNLLDKSGLIFTYGVTNAGKTYTIIGTKENPGLLPRAINSLLEAREKILDNLGNPEATFTVNDSFEVKMENIIKLNGHPEYQLSGVELCMESFEIYNEDIYDLLVEPKKDKKTGRAHV